MLEDLESIDWDFKESNTERGLHQIHPYPAKFIPEIPEYLIKTLGCPNGVVFDPFCGSGTTLNVAQSLGYKSIGVDLNPIACLVSRVKTRPIPLDFNEIANHVVTEAQALPVNLDEISFIPNIDHWFKKEIQKNILSLKLSIQKHKNRSDVFDALRVALSSILVRVSNQDSDTRYAAIEKNINPKMVFSLFLSSCLKLYDYLLKKANHKESIIINKDILKTTPEDIGKEVGVIVTSPPYPNAYEYWLYHKYRMWWLDFDPLAVKNSEIGARAHFFKKNRHTSKDFFHQMKGTLDLSNKILIDGGLAAFVVGRSKIHGEIVDNAELIINAAEDLGFSIIGRINRTMNKNRKSFNLSHAKIKEETIVVVRKI